MRTIIGYTLLQLGDTFLTGDEYGVGFCFHIGDRAETSFAEGSKVCREILFYRPRRPIYGQQSFTLKEATLHLLRLRKPDGHIAYHRPIQQWSPPPTLRGRWFYSLRRSLAIRLHTLANRIDPP